MLKQLFSGCASLRSCRSFSSFLFQTQLRSTPAATTRTLYPFLCFLRTSTLSQRLKFSVSSALRDNKENESKDGDEEKNGLPNLIGYLITASIAVITMRLLHRYERRKEEMASNLQMNDEPSAFNSKLISFPEFEEHLLRKGEVKEIRLYTIDEKQEKTRENSNFAHIFVRPGALWRGIPLPTTPSLSSEEYPLFRVPVRDIKKFEARIRDIESEMQIPVTEQIPINFRDLRAVSRLLSYILWIIFGVSLYFLTRKSFAKSFKNVFTIRPDDLLPRRHVLVEHFKSKKYRVSFKDVAGLHEAKVEVMEFVDYLKNSKKLTLDNDFRYTALGARLPKGSLLLGPPGCGKTLLAKAVASEANVPFLSISGSEFVEVLGGVGAQRVRSLFKDARKRAPCIIYIDEIDAIGRKRSSESSTFSSSEEENTLNQLLSEMDGIGSVEDVLVLAATNRIDLLDKALLRPGRFDRHILIDYPTLAERREIFQMYLSKLKLADEIRIEGLVEELSHVTPGMTGYHRQIDYQKLLSGDSNKFFRQARTPLLLTCADISNVCNEAAIHAASARKSCIAYSDFEIAVDKILAGTEKKSNVLSPAERKMIAYKEAGHTLVAWLLENIEPPLKVTVKPRVTGRYGYTQLKPKEIQLFSKEEIFDKMCVMIGGRVAESIVFNHTSTAAEKELQSVTELAYQTVREFGMSSVVGLVSFPATDGTLQRKPYSKYLQKIIDQEARRLITLAYKKSDELIRENRDKLNKLAAEILCKELLTFSDLKLILGPPLSELKSNKSTNTTYRLPYL